VRNQIKTVWVRLIGIDAGRWWAIYLCLLAIIPAFVGSLILPDWLAPVTVCGSACAAYFAFKAVQPSLFKLCPKTSYLYLSLPLYTVCLGWAAVLVALGQFEQVPRSVGPVFLLLVVCIWPVHRFKVERTERRVPFESVYPVYAGLVALQQVAIIWKEIL
jgi:hypothetical protein